MILFLNAVVILLGFIASVFGKKFGLITGWKSGYVAIVSGIFLAFLIFMIFNTDHAKLFIIFGIMGMALEAAVDFFYKAISRERLFAYKHLTIFGYGSILSFPFWGAAGIMFYAIGDLIK
ncbi:MAG: hypothetical protein A3B96_00160 [Candidatus Spechtbacteria bacterium RIFCSPHIGHO2_02_FULL_43_15b]|uniref:Uncharacterized protein n=1 Tax=Candidatus Spechtbacteria bacterium RIFCSPHIGHO2_01_FULL_43_30 TaxID=1802158 RepID=A0A1G2H5C7_9BACT|nr:MAG: hypothetical protein A2827_00900 [Candidatus Spechtbacteria bacterium RIFCSPHIGHO2_01_FULL_43_30]OGZ60351.1 MAG: hypothetical protein A3B96_00160 [Candidatus Spechtbacteria bacterium RIFCSPHIGHO2_02_FULL_43_15b]